MVATISGPRGIVGIDLEGGLRSGVERMRYALTLVGVLGQGALISVFLGR
jgi:hypothetical protein